MAGENAERAINFVVCKLSQFQDLHRGISALIEKRWLFYVYLGLGSKPHTR